MFGIVYAAIVDPAQPTPLTGLETVFKNILNILIPLGGLALLVMLIIGGFMFITSGGDPRKAEGAKNTLTYAIVGIVILASAFLIIKVIADFTGVQGILKFRIFIPQN